MLNAELRTAEGMRGRRWNGCGHNRKWRHHSLLALGPWLSLTQTGGSEHTALARLRQLRDLIDTPRAWTAPPIPMIRSQVPNNALTPEGSWTKSDAFDYATLTPLPCGGYSRLNAHPKLLCTTARCSICCFARRRSRQQRRARGRPHAAQGGGRRCHRCRSGTGWSRGSASAYGSAPTCVVCIALSAAHGGGARAWRWHGWYTLGTPQPAAATASRAVHRTYTGVAPLMVAARY